MEHLYTFEEHEALNTELNDDTQLEAYKGGCDKYPISAIPRFFGFLLIGAGNLFYGHEPSYLKFRAIEVIARVPYQSWASAAYTMLTLFYSDEHKAIGLGNLSEYARLANDNETMHVIVITQLARKEERAGVFRHTVIPMFFAFFYFWASYILYLIKPRWSYELNYLFENHAFDQYDEFIREHRNELENKSANCDFLNWYGRNFRNQYEFFRSIRNDELIHRNQSVRKLGDS